MNELPAIYGQRDPRWAQVHLGYPSAGAASTLGNYGCYVTTDAIVASYFGQPITPPELNERFVAAACYVQGNLLTDSSLSRIFPECKYETSLYYGNGPADLAKLQSLLESPHSAVILEVDFNPSHVGVQTHFVVAVQCDGERVTIADPWTGTLRNLADAYGDPKTAIQKFVLYSGTPVAPAQEIDVTDTERQEMQAQIDQKDGLIAELSGQVGSLQWLLGLAQGERDGLAAEVERLKALDAADLTPEDAAKLEKYERIRELVSA